MFNQFAKQIVKVRGSFTVVCFRGAGPLPSLR